MPGGKIQIANYLCPGNYAVSGSLEAAKVLEEIAKPEFGARMTVRLAVAGAFHTEYMAPAVEKLKEVLAGTEVRVSTFLFPRSIYRLVSSPLFPSPPKKTHTQQTRLLPRTCTQTLKTHIHKTVQDAPHPRHLQRRRQGAYGPGGDQGHSGQTGDEPGAVGDYHEQPGEGWARPRL